MPWEKVATRPPIDGEGPDRFWAFDSCINTIVEQQKNETRNVGI
jgi:hypothetical protein